MQDFKIPPDHIRGVGIQVSRLENEKNSNSLQLMDKFIVKKIVPKKEVLPCDNVSIKNNESDIKCRVIHSKGDDNAPMNKVSSELILEYIF